VSPERAPGAEDEIESKKQEAKTDEAGLEEERDGLVLDDFLGGGVGDGVELVHGDAGTTEADSKKHGEGRLGPGGEGGGIEIQADVGGFGNVTIKGGFWRDFRGCGEHFRMFL